MASSSTDTPLQELKHDAVPGYLKAFFIAFAAMGLYLAVILISSPGSAKAPDKSSHSGKVKPGDH
jgi:hypothetical protein